MNARTTVSMIGTLFILGTIQLLGALGGAPWVISCGVAIGLASGFLLDFFDAGSLPWWTASLLASAASSLGILVSTGGGANLSPAAMWAAARSLRFADGPEEVGVVGHADHLAPVAVPGGRPDAGGRLDH